MKGMLNFLEKAGLVKSDPPTESIPAASDVAPPPAVLPAAVATTVGSGMLDASFNQDGNTAFQFATWLASGPNSGFNGSSGAYGPTSVFKFGGLAPYAGNSSTVTPSITYDVNNCVTSVWLNVSINGHIRRDSNKFINTGFNTATCKGGTWTMAGDQRYYASSIHTRAFQWNDAAKTVVNELILDTSSTNNNTYNYAYVTFSGPGLVTYGNQTTETPVVVGRSDYRMSDVNIIVDPHYRGTTANSYYSTSGSGLEGSAALRSCAFIATHLSGGWGSTATSATPCYNGNVAAGSNYTVKFYLTAVTGVPLATNLAQLDVSPNSVFPKSWFATGTVATTASPLVQGSTVSVNWTLPAGAISGRTHLNLNDLNGQTVYNYWHGNFATTTSRIITLQAMPGGGVSGVGQNYAGVGVTTNGVDMITILPAF